jgi:hypothetical protein
MGVRATGWHNGGPPAAKPATESGDYVVWAPGVSHTYRAEVDSVVITVRWPSLVPGEHRDA